MKVRAVVGVALLVSLLGMAFEGRNTLSAQATSNDNNIVMMDNCLPGDPGYTPATGGCQQKPQAGDVPSAEFGMLLTSPLISGLVGHPSWRNEPSHVTVNAGRTVRVTNRGGRGHTLTRVANFGGGLVAPLNAGATPAPECLSLGGKDTIAPGGAGTVANLQPGLNRYQCCFHPWMRATIRVE
jgi:plastocyanin